MLEEGVDGRSLMHLKGKKKLSQSIVQIFMEYLLRTGAKSWQVKDRRVQSVTLISGLWHRFESSHCHLLAT